MKMQHFRDYFTIVVENTKRETEGKKPNLTVERNRLEKILTDLLERKPTREEVSSFLK